MPLDNPLVQESLQFASLLNAWTNYGAPFNNASYWKDSLGVVHLNGVLQGGASATTIFLLPLGYRPINREALTTHCNSSTLGNHIGRVDVFADGSVFCQVGVTSGTTIAFFLDGLTFRAA